MRAVRQRLSSLIAVWLLCQLTGMAAAPVSVATMASSAELKCTCPPDGAPGGNCPLHHHAHEGARTCVLRSGSSSGEAALLSLVAGLAMMPPIQTVVAAVAPAEFVAPVVASALTAPARPESPPPRA